MLFNSLQFAIFFPIVIGLYFLLPGRRRWLLLLAASYFFYMSWRVEYILLILFSTGIDYWTGRLLGQETRPRRRKSLLALSLTTNLGLLFFFKYFNFLNDSLRIIFTSRQLPYTIPDSTFLLPVGISFYTFQTLSYTIDMYRGKIKPEQHAGIFALFVSFFPQLVAGPIERAENLLPQFQQTHRFSYQRTVSGLQRMAWGFFKKLVIADRLAVLVNTVYAEPGQFTGVPLVIATYAFAYQIYCDFSGYSDIAIGAARIMGFELMENFRQPYFAPSIPEFWRRWHISLSTWFRDYLYIPLGGNRAGTGRWLLNILLVFTISGLWHGANWTFVIWGGLHGLLMLATIGWQRLNGRLHLTDRLPAALGRGMGILLTFHLVTFAWIFFRAASLADALTVLRNLPQGWLRPLSQYDLAPGLSNYELLIAAVALLLLEGVHLWQARYGSVQPALRRAPVWLRWTLYYGLILIILMFGKFGLTQFIYFQF